MYLLKQHLGYHTEFISGIKTKFRILNEIFISGIIITITKILTILQTLGLLKYFLSFKRHLTIKLRWTKLTFWVKMTYLKSYKT